jgi:hypothetical protein
MDVHQRQNGKWCYVDHQRNVGHKYSPMSEWIGQFETRQEAVLAARAEAAEAECERLLEVLTNIGNYAHDASTGPTVPDAFWEIRKMAYEALADNTSQVAAGAAQRCNEL